MAPVVRELKRFPRQIRLTVAVTGQHREMLDQILRAFSIVPDHDLDIMRPGQTLAEITCRSLSGLDGLLERESPDIVLAQGDTTTTFVASLAAFYRKIDFGHVEAGLRSDYRWEPFPEEMNRRMVTLCASLHFAPTELARERLLREGVPPEDVYLTGNTVIDALQEIASRDEPLKDSGLAGWLGQGRLVLVTAHRRENWGGPMESICRALRRVADAVEDARVVFAMHRNPVVRRTVHAVLGRAQPGSPDRAAGLSGVRPADAACVSHPDGFGRGAGGGPVPGSSGARPPEHHRAAGGGPVGERPAGGVG
jgi:UDP-N-acetylglucosamine 2-epimerase (non-hydrolysing)